MIRLVPFNETHIKLVCDDWGLEQEISDYFTFFVHGYRYNPKFKNGMWDGKIRLIDQRRKTIYRGLMDEVISYCKSRSIEFEVDVSLKNTIDITLEQSSGFVDKLNLHARGEKLDIRDYQYDAVHQVLSHNRRLLLSPTASGKSMIIYSAIRWHLQHERNILIIVPTTLLVEQLFSDFKEYSTANGFDVEANISTLYSGKERVFDKPVVISTWQSLAAMLKNDAEKYQTLVDRTDVLCFDEIHLLAKATVVQSVVEKFTKTKYRIGTTGTLDDAKINALTLTGLIGPIYKVTTTARLMADQHVVELDIKCTVLNYPDHIRKAYKGQTYQEEINFLVGYEPRNRFLAKLTSVLPGNVLVLFNFVDRHGAVLEKMVKEITDRPVFFIHGGVATADRELIRKLLDNEKNAIVIATASLMSTGVNIPSIENIVFAIPSKSTIRVRQSIGRGLRLKDGKTKCKLFDISDDLSYKSYTNTTLKHLEERIGIYEKESFQYTISKISIS